MDQEAAFLLPKAHGDHRNPSDPFSKTHCLPDTLLPARGW